MKTSVSNHTIGVSELNLSRPTSDFLKIATLGKRAHRVLLDMGAEVDLMTIIMDIEAVHEYMPLDLDKLAAFPDTDFTHDVVGIYVNIDRTRKVLRNCFCPRAVA
jgi:hypothetical protein